jgi:hypothetical protein
MWSKLIVGLGASFPTSSDPVVALKALRNAGEARSWGAAADLSETGLITYPLQQDKKSAYVAGSGGEMRESAELNQCIGGVAPTQE